MTIYRLTGQNLSNAHASGEISSASSFEFQNWVFRIEIFQAQSKHNIWTDACLNKSFRCHNKIIQSAAEVIYGIAATRSNFLANDMLSFPTPPPTMRSFSIILVQVNHNFLKALPG